MIKSDKRKKVYKFSYVSIWKIDIQICIWMTQDMQDRSGLNFISVNGTTLKSWAADRSTIQFLSLSAEGHST